MLDLEVLATRAHRRAYRRERMPAHLRWAMTNEGLHAFYAVVRARLREPLGARAEEVLAASIARMLYRRYPLLVERYGLPSLEQEPRALALLMSALYLVPLSPRRAWTLRALGGAADGVREQVRSVALARQLTAEQRWEEITVHLGEVLILLVEDLREELPRAPRLLGQTCFEMGAAYARAVMKQFRLERDGDDVELAIEILRMGEYLFRVNPLHEIEADNAARTGYIVGNACPWHSRPGWNPMHCGIYGQFQAGICSIFDLRYALTTTIPKHGGHVCRVDITDLASRRPEEAAE